MKRLFQSILAAALAGFLLQAASQPAGWSSLSAAGAEQPVSIPPAAKEEQEALSPGMELVAEQGELQLFLNHETTEIAVKNTRSKQMWFSNPPQAAKDPIATPYHQGKLMSQLSLTYVTKTGQEKEYDSYHDSVALKQFEIAKLADGVRVVYTLGKMERGIEAVPAKVSKDRFEGILERLTEDKDKAELKKRFRFVEDKQIYERRDIADFVLAKVISILDKAGYSEEDLKTDNEQNNIAAEESGQASQFTIPLEYRLANNQLRVTIPASEIRQTGDTYLLSVSLLEYFGAAGKSEEGYMFVPDGSGALIRLNNNKLYAEAAYIPLYGEDKLLTREEKLTTNIAARMPVFGMKKGNDAFIAMIQEGDAIAAVQADISGRVNSYNAVFSSFLLTNKDTVTLRGGERTNSSTLFQKKMHQGNLTVAYGFLSGGKANYSGMAQYYQAELVSKNKMKRLDVQSQADMPFFLELIGGVSATKRWLGIPYKTVQPLTTYEQMKEIVQQLKASGVSHMKVGLNGWFNQGVEHTLPHKIKLDSQLGGKKQFQELQHFLEQNEIGFYPEAAFLDVYSSGSGLKVSDDAAQTIANKPAKLYAYNPATLLFDRDRFSHYVLSPSKLPSVVDRFLAQYQKLGAAGLTLRDMADEINADYRAKKLYDRQGAAEVIEQELAKIQGRITDLTVRGGNAYTLPYASTILNAPMTSNQFMIEDDPVPFYQMVISGYIDYAGEPFNLALNQDYNYNLLRAIETGSIVYYQWMYEKPSSLKGTSFNSLYSNYYADWMEEAVAMYQEVNEALKPMRGQRMIAHEQVAPNVYKTVYENGIASVVNFNDEAVTVEKRIIDAKSYWVGRNKE
ncbi:DUF5696 domain-containing protein [Paenibacillus sp. GCM10027626]|uniref:DUF5696 domain-containing protein n=1 Tax=Paenibacillus sp. GCM10027626 TaxID=3273411 RepID=UPI0036263BF7